MVDAIPDHFETSQLYTDEEKAVVAASIELSKKAELSNEAFDRIARHLDERQIVELVVNIGVANMNNRFTDALWADVEEKE
jgi:alkylhydroperoxidase family enzyme